MNAPAAAIKASFSDYRRVKGRKVGQLVFEVPLESFQAAIAALGGEPAAVEERWVGIALLDPAVLAEKAAPVSAPKAEKRRFDELPASQQAAMLCNEPRFWRFLLYGYGYRCDGDTAPQFVRDICGVVSRSDLDHSLDARRRWDNLRSEYEAWKLV